MISENRMHDKRSFFKYMPASTAKIVLENKTLRWSSPIEFNDPFDVPRELAFGVSPKEIQRALVEKLTQLIYEPPVNTDSLPEVIKVVLEAIKQSGNEELKKTMAKALLEELDNSSNSSAALEEFQSRWRQMIPELRILCLSEHHDKASMWYHYADKYQGAVVEFICCDKTDSALLLAKKMDYPTEKPGVYTATGWADFLLLPQRDALESIINLATHTKSPDWAYEDEWRVSTWKRIGEYGTVSDYPLNDAEFGNLYLGPLMSEPDRHTLVELAKRFPNMKVFDTRIGMSREFLFEEIAG
ncbi:DUF2971 domain-containing protein [Vibrio vulnificus]|nr:DUF2971 domain-containing protein [Vibrio vulnificus]HDY8146028.1 DUF2971 domain-containing protein [Vibrio vulnificus]